MDRHCRIVETEAARNGPQASIARPRPGTPYLYHYVVDAMLECGMRQEALDLIRSYWGGMVEAGADPPLSPYKSVLVNRYCHAWSCTHACFLRGRQLI